MRIASLLTLLFLSTSLSAQETVPVPVRKVVLYKNGMGYFEHLGTVKGQQSVEIVLPSSQLNDVLKSLTVIDLGKGQVAGVTYDSTAPLDRRLSELPIDLNSAQGLVGFLNQIRGAGVEIRMPAGPVSGKLMSAEVKTRSTAPGSTVQIVQIAIFAPSGEVRLVELESVGALRLTDPALASEIARYLDLLDTAHQRDVRRLRIQTVGSGERQLYVSYTSEAPIWKTTYRVVLDPKQKPLLQGWAIVDNTTPMDWVDVTLSLVAGAPISFVQNLSQPLYARRPVVPLPAGVQVTPQIHEGALQLSGGRTSIAGVVNDPSQAPVPGATVAVLDEGGNLVRQVVSDDKGQYSADVPPGTYRIRASLAGFQNSEYQGIQVQPGRTIALNFTLQVGAVSEAVVVEKDVLEDSRRSRREMMNMPASPPLPSVGATAGIAGGSLGEVMRQRAPVAAQTQAVAEQFEYKLRQPATIRKNESGLLPIIHAEVEGDKVSVYSESSGERHPRLAVWLKNTSGMTLDAGSFTVIDTNAFAGEGLIESIQPAESRLLSYAVDVGVEVSTNIGSERQKVERVQISRGVLRMHSKMVEKKTYTIRNNDEKARAVVLEHRLRPGWKLIETAQPAESSANHYRFKVEAKAKTTTEFVVREESPQEITYGIINITPEQIALWVRERSIDPEIEKALGGIVAKKNEINELAQKMATLEKEQGEIFRDQERVRGNLQRLGQTPEEATLRQRYIRQLEQQENRLGALRAERDRLDNARAQAQKQLDQMLQNLTLDRKL